MNLSKLQPDLSSCNLFSWIFGHGDKKLIEISFYSAMEIFGACEIQSRYQSRPNLPFGCSFTTYYIYNLLCMAAAFSLKNRVLLGTLCFVSFWLGLVFFWLRFSLGLLDHCYWSLPISSWYWKHCWALATFFFCLEFRPNSCKEEVMGMSLINSTRDLKFLQSAIFYSPREYLVACGNHVRDWEMPRKGNSSLVSL